MKQQSQSDSLSAAGAALQAGKADALLPSLKSDQVFIDVFQKSQLGGLHEFLSKLGLHAGKRSFLVFKNNKYVNILTDNIAFFYVRYESSILVTIDKQEYFVNYSLEQIQNLLPGKQFFRLNRQYLVNFDAVKEVEHYFARKLLVNLVIPTIDKLIVPKEKASSFFTWLDNR